MYRTDIEREILESLHWGNGYSVQRIADEFGCCYGTILRLMKEYDIERHTGGSRTTEFDLDYKERRIFRDLRCYDMNRMRKRKPKVPAEGTSDSNTFNAYFAPLRIKKHM